MSRHSNEARLEEILAICMAELFAEERVKTERFLGEHEPLSLRESLTVFCGFGGTRFRGHALMNQIAGRCRHRLLTCDVSLALAVSQSELAKNVRSS